MNENYDVTFNLEFGGYGIDRAENLAFSIAYGALESLLNSPPTSWQSFEDAQLRSEYVIFRSSIDPLELQSNLSLSVSNRRSSSEIKSDSHSKTNSSKIDQSIDETVVILASIANSEDINLNQPPKVIPIVKPIDLT